MPRSFAEHVVEYWLLNARAMCPGVFYRLVADYASREPRVRTRLSRGNAQTEPPSRCERHLGDLDESKAAVYAAKAA